MHDDGTNDGKPEKVPKILFIFNDFTYYISWGAKRTFALDRSETRLDDMRLTGTRLDLGMVVGSVAALRDLTEEFNATATLPQKIQNRIDGFITDMREAASHVVAIENSAEVPVLDVTREVVAADGSKATVMLAQLPLAQAPAPAKRKKPAMPDTAP